MRTNDLNSASTPAAHPHARLTAALSAALIALLLAACGAPSASEEGAEALDAASLGYLSSLERLDGSGPLYDPSQGNCIVHEFGTPSQGFHMAGSGFHMAGSGFHMAGSVGGLMANPPTSPVVPSQVPTPLATDGGDIDTAVLVVDDFAGNGWEIDPILYKLPQADTPTMQQIVAQGGFSHGSLVMHHVNATVAATGLYQIESVEPEQVLWRHVGSGARLVVRMADAQGFNADVVPNAIDSGLRALYSQGIDRVAVNMSFALVPCSVVDDFLDNLASFPVFEDYVAAVTGGNPADVAALIDGIREATENDPLRYYLQHPDFRGGEEQVRVPVAAAGNFWRDYAMYPAAWPEVLSVSASDAHDPTTRAFFSNGGEVMETGSWFRIEGLGITAKPGQASILAYAGTSFSGPATAAMSAIDLASGDPRCALLSDDATLLAHGSPKNVPLEEAIQIFCR